MPVLTLESISKSIAGKRLFEEVTFGIEPGERVAVIGVNGSGKTTLLRIAAGLEPPDGGRVVLASGARLEYLAQNPDLDPSATVLDLLFRADTPTMRLLRDYEAAAEAVSRHPDDAAALARLAELSAAMDLEDGWEAEGRARTILRKLGITEMGATIGALSGGQRKRVALARALLDPADLLIMDEPTNHIDIEMIAWLEEWLARWPGALLLVTHDRYFLDRVAGRIIELDRGRVYSHPGNYSAYLEARAAREEREAQAEVKRQNRLRRELAWLRRGARARSTKQKAHVQRIQALMAQGPIESRSTVQLSVPRRRLGKRVVELHGVSKAMGGRTLIRDFSYALAPGDRVGIIGPNGAGKSTLLNLIAGRLSPDRGEVVWGETVHIALYDQETGGLDENQRVIDAVKEIAEYLPTAGGERISAAQMLERFLFPPEAQWGVIGKLSGGERRRLALLRTLMQVPNVLLLDEPTNDLDIETLTILEEYLDDFPGTVVVASHDRAFLDRTVEHLFAFEGEGIIRHYPGNYSFYLERRAAEAAEMASQDKKGRGRGASGSNRAPRPRGLTYQEQRELEALEPRISELERRRREVQEEINAAGSDYLRLQRLADELARLDQELEAAMERWAELAEIAEGAATGKT